MNETKVGEVGADLVGGAMSDTETRDSAEEERQERETIRSLRRQKTEWRRREARRLKLPVYLMDRVEQLAVVVCGRFFAMMVNPEMQGSAWRWEKFPECCVGQLRSQVAMSLGRYEYARYREALKRYSEEAARDEAQEILDESRILTWWKYAKYSKNPFQGAGDTAGDEPEDEPEDGSGGGEGEVV